MNDLSPINQTNQSSFIQNSNLNKVHSFNLPSDSRRSLQVNQNPIINQQQQHNPKSLLQRHHFYQLTSTSKEVDIDDNQQQYHNHRRHSLHRNEMDKKLSLNPSCNNNDNDEPTGPINLSKNVEKRVNEWLSSSTAGLAGDTSMNNSQNQKVITQNNEPQKFGDNLNNSTMSHRKSIPPKVILDNNNSELIKNNQNNQNNKTKTTVAYYLPNEDLPYLSTFVGTCLTLAEFKRLITKKGNFRYFFKTKTDLLEEDCIVFQEVTDENSHVPMLNNKVIAKIENPNQSC
jgi:hypothetical protein